VQRPPRQRLRPNAVTVHVGTGINFSDYPTQVELNHRAQSSLQEHLCEHGPAVKNYLRVPRNPARIADQHSWNCLFATILTFRWKGLSGECELRGLPV
jgi:hypothetical protein